MFMFKLNAIFYMLEMSFWIDNEVVLIYDYVFNASMVWFILIKLAPISSLW